MRPDKKSRLVSSRQGLHAARQGGFAIGAIVIVLAAAILGALAGLAALKWSDKLFYDKESRQLNAVGKKLDSMGLLQKRWMAFYSGELKNDVANEIAENPAIFGMSNELARNNYDKHKELEMAAIAKNNGQYNEEAAKHGKKAHVYADLAIMTGSWEYAGDLFERYMYGMGVEKDPAKAATLAYVGCNAVHTPACGMISERAVRHRDFTTSAKYDKEDAGRFFGHRDDNYGSKLFYGVGVDRDAKEGLRIIEAGCFGNPWGPACEHAANMNYVGANGMERNIFKARTMYRLAEFQGQHIADKLLATLELRNEFAKRFPWITQERTKDCSKNLNKPGGARICRTRGIMSLLGMSVPKNKAEATQFTGLACYSGDWRACYALDYPSYVTSLSINPKKALELYSAQCERGDMRACWVQGLIEWETRDLWDDYKVAMELFNKSCKGGFVDGCSPFGIVDSMEFREANMVSGITYNFVSRGCAEDDAGMGPYCALKAFMMLEQNGLKRNALVDAMGAVRKGCYDGYDGTACLLYSDLHMEDIDGKGFIDPVHRGHFRQFACAFDKLKACEVPFEGVPEDMVGKPFNYGDLSSPSITRQKLGK